MYQALRNVLLEERYGESIANQIAFYNHKGDWRSVLIINDFGGSNDSPKDRYVQYVHIDEVRCQTYT